MYAFASNSRFCIFQKGRLTSVWLPKLQQRLIISILLENWQKKFPHIHFLEIERILNIGSAAVQTIVQHWFSSSTNNCTCTLVSHKTIYLIVVTFLYRSAKSSMSYLVKCMHQKFNHDESRAMYVIITGDETWMYHCDP